MATRKNLDRAREKNNPFPVQDRLWVLIYQRGTLDEVAHALGKSPTWMSQVLDGVYDLKWSFVKQLCDYLGVENPREVIL